MKGESKRDGLQRIIDEALEKMGHDRSDAGFDPMGVNLAEFCRTAGMSRSRARTLRKKGFRAAHGRCGSKAETTVLSGFEGDLDDLLRRGVTNSTVCLEAIRAGGYAGGLTTVKNYIAANAHLVPAPRRTPEPSTGRGQRFETGPGECYQMDWGFVRVEDPAGNSWRMACFAVVCHHCGTCYVEFFPNARQENLFIGMIRAFSVLGVPERVLTDNMRSVVLRRDHEGAPVWQADYEEFMEAVGFATRLCKPRHPYTKGKVERLVRFVKDNFLAGRTFSDITDLNEQAAEWCARQACRWRRSTVEAPGAVHAAECLPRTRALAVTPAVSAYLCPERRISFDGFVNYEGRMFGVPYWYPGRTCRVGREGRWLHVYSADMSVELAVHPVTWRRGDSVCPGQWAEPDCPEELPTAPVRATLAVSPPRPGGLERFDFESRCGR